MAQTHTLGFPRIGYDRTLKTTVERYWRGAITRTELERVAADLRRQHWQLQARSGIDRVPVGDFSLYDHMLDMSLSLGNVPSRFAGDAELDETDRAFRIARGATLQDGTTIAAAEMTKWFDTNYHYIVPEFTSQTQFSADPQRLASQITEAYALGVEPKLVLPGPLTYLYLGKSKDASFDRLSLMHDLLQAYDSIFEACVRTAVLCQEAQSKTVADGIRPLWIQIDEPVLALDLPLEWQEAFPIAYEFLGFRYAFLLLAVYFGPVRDNLDLVMRLPVAGLHIDAVRGTEDVSQVVEQWPQDKVLSLGVVDGRNIWRSNLEHIIEELEPVHKSRGDLLWIAPSCSLLHVPVDLETEAELDAELRSWLAFAVQKLEELSIIKTALTHGSQGVAQELSACKAAMVARRTATRIINPAIRTRLADVTPEMLSRSAPFPVRIELQRKHLNLPPFPTTTIGSFPQTKEIRSIRKRFKSGELSHNEYIRHMQKHIDHAIEQQESYGLDVLVHGEAERNDMVEYFGEQLNGYAFTTHGWVQSYGTRCVKPPIIYGDVSRPEPMTIDWITYAQSRTHKPMKGMLTGPITMMQWAFVRDDQPRHETARQIALALRDEVVDLENAGIRIIQVDEAALREGLPLRRTEWNEWLQQACESFRLATSGVRNETQVHTHMCYSEFNDIVDSIINLDADVITIEAARSDMELLDAFETLDYPNEIGPGVYDIHSPNVPSVDFMVGKMREALRRIPAQRLWVNPDCGLKTRAWREVEPSLKNMVEAARILRSEV